MAENNPEDFGEVPQARQRRYTLPSVGIITIFPVIVSFLCCVTSDEPCLKSIKSLFYTFIVSCAAILVGRMIRRSCLIFEEKHHLNTRYHGNWSRMLNAIDNRKDDVGLLVFVCIGVVLCINDMNLFMVNINTLNIFAAISVIPLVFDLINLNELSEVERSELGERSSQSVAHGLAWSYYFGYLKIVLPELINQINESEKWSNLFIGGELLPKVFALIPKTGFMVGEICDDRKQMIYVDDEEEDVLPPLFMERGGVKKRVYRNTVYTIKDQDGREHYAIMEYVTPVDTIYRMNQHREAGMSEDEKDMQIKLLYRYLKEITDKEEDCRGRFVLVPISGKEKHHELRDIMLDALEKAR
ncbi:stimulator of interferon genes protein 2-like [Saccoglossus kowalevskii]|uniref:Stimulator of interferon genes protein-like n=1 Tax=Saccoglossus kowalevskii TaxID=10224 RepID=A0ABM0LYE3_SACKO|nr:PREDICTED: stimulator of interferon genes protein-like [Saccoglossus kowalevskii]